MTMLAGLLVALAAIAATAAASPKKGRTPKTSVAGQLDRSFGKGGKVAIPFPAENAGDVGVKYTLPFQFTAGHLVMAATPGGKLVVAGSTRIARLLPNGKPDPSFGVGGFTTIPQPAGMSFVLAGVAVDSLGRVLIGGSARPLPTSTTPDPLISSAAVMRFAADGSPDGSFGQGGTLVSDFGIKAPEIGSGRYKGAAVGLRSLTVDSQNRPVVSGGSVTKIVYCGGETAISTGFVARLTESGALDPGFGEAGLRQISDLSSFEQGSLVPGGGLFAVGLGKPRCSGEGGGPPVVLTGFGLEGSLNPRFGFAGFRAIGYPSAPVAAVAPSGKIVLLGAKDKDGKQVVIRLLPNGAADPGFGRTGRVQVSGLKHAALAAVAVDRHGRLLFAGRATRRVSKRDRNHLTRSTFLLGRMNPEGNFDRSFGDKGSLTTGFGGPASSFATQVMFDAKGRILVGGGVSTPRLGTGGGFALARYLSGP
jgi:uncharacterized delta-60 repeat protein